MLAEERRGTMSPDQDLRTDLLRLKATLYDPNTDLFALPAVLDSVRGLLDATRWLGLIHVEVDAFSRIETIYGWQVFDRLLRAVSAVLHEAKGDILPPETILAEAGIYGGRFVIVAPLPGAARAPMDALDRASAGVAARLTERFGAPDFHSMAPPLSVHVGYAAFSDQPFLRLERVVYRAIEEARQLGRQGEPQRRSREHAEIRRIIREGDIEVVFQPVVDLRDWTVFGYEAFCRGPRNSAFEPPLAMFACSQDVGVARDLDLLCQRRILDCAAGRVASGKLFLNALPASLLDPGFRDGLLADLPEGLRLTREDIVLEIADRDAIGDYEAFGEEVGELRARGFGLAVDDVGAGSGSLQTIAEIRPDFIKVDGSLVRNVHSNLVKQEMLRSLAQVARSIEAAVVAEGIESAEEMAAVRECGIDYGQGYHFARPHREPPAIRRREA